MSRKRSIIIISIIILVSLMISIYIPNREKIEENEDMSIIYETIEKDGKEVDAKRIFGVMGLGVKCGETITLKVDGEKEEEAFTTLSKFLEENL